MAAASAAIGPSGMYQHHRLNSSSLVVLLQQWTQKACAPSTQDVAEHLSQWLGPVDAVRLGGALHSIESGLRKGPGQALDVVAMEAACQAARTEVTQLITAPPAPARPVRGRADNTPVEEPDPEVQVDFALHAARYLALQKQMETRLAALRARMRQWLSKEGGPLLQLAALDAVMEQMLGAREQRLWASLPGHLEKRMAQRLQAHQRALLASSQDDEPRRWRQAGGWLWAFDQDMQALLLAEMQVRLQPITGLLEAARNEKTGQQE